MKWQPSRRKRAASVPQKIQRGARSISTRVDSPNASAAFSEANGGLIRYDDLKSFRAETDAPRTITYRGYEIYKPGFWTQGPVMLEALNILEGYRSEGDGTQQPRVSAHVVEAVKLAFADRDRYYGDPKFSARFRSRRSYRGNTPPNAES